MAQPVRDFDVAIIGAGPAGCSCALQLADSGLDIAVIEKGVFPRDKVCGDALSPDVINQLSLLGLAADFSQLPKQNVNRMRFIAPNHQPLEVQFTNPKHTHAAGYIAKRRDFDHYLFRRLADTPVCTFEGQAVKQITQTEAGILLHTDQDSFRAKMLLGADGANSVVSRQLSSHQLRLDHYCAGLRQYYEGVEGLEKGDCIELHFYKELLPGYFWIFALPNGQANVGLGMLSSEVSKRRVNLKATLDQLIASHPNIKDRFRHARPLEKPRGFGLPIGSRKRSCSGERFLLLGDAASLIDPFTGEGIGNAIRSGRVAASHVREAFAQQRFDAMFHQQYDAELYRRMWAELRVGRSMQKMLRYPQIFNFVVNKAAKNKSVQTLLTAMLSDIDLRKELRKPSFYTKLFFK